jgi:hypothetical protein
MRAGPLRLATTTRHMQRPRTSLRTIDRSKHVGGRRVGSHDGTPGVSAATMFASGIISTPRE